MHYAGASDFGDEFLFAIALAAEQGGQRVFGEAVQAAFVAGAVNGFMERGAVILRDFGELLHQRQHDFVKCASVVRLILHDVLELDAGAGDVALQGGFGGFDGFRVLGGQLIRPTGFDAFYVFDVKDIEVTQEWQAFHDGVAFGVGHGVAVLVFALARDNLPKDYHVGFGTLLDLAATGFCLIEGDVLARLQHELIEQAVRLAGGVADSAGTDSAPRFIPRNDAVFQLGNDAVGDFLINVFAHGVLPSALRRRVVHLM